MAFCVNRNLVTGMPPSVSKAVTNQNDLVTGKVLYFSLWKIRRVIPAKTSLADNPDLKSDNRNNRSFSVDGLRLGITFGNICSCRLRVAFLSSRTDVVAGCELRNQHRNGNYHIFFVELNPALAG